MQYTSPARARAKRRALRRRVVFFAAVLAGLALIYMTSSLLADWLSTPRGPHVIALDAGHGGGDTGAAGLNQIQEQQLTVQTAQALWALLEADPEFTPVMVRGSWEASATAGERARQAKRSKADLLLSIHMNSDGGSGEASGFECFPAPPNSIYNADSLRFADLLAAEMSAAGAALRGNGGVRYAYYTPEGARVIREREDLNEQHLESFAVVELPGCPAVLAEQCFITNEADLAVFGTPEGCEKAAGCYYRAIRSYFGLNPAP